MKFIKVPVLLAQVSETDYNYYKNNNIEIDESMASISDIYINTDKIIAFNESTDSKDTTITMDGLDTSLICKLNIEQFLKLVNE